MGHGRCLPRRTCEAHLGTRTQSGLCTLPHDIMFTARGGPRTPPPSGIAPNPSNTCPSHGWTDGCMGSWREQDRTQHCDCLKRGGFGSAALQEGPPWPRFPLWVMESGSCGSSEGALLQQHKVRPSSCCSVRKTNFLPLGHGCSLLSQDRAGPFLMVHETEVVGKEQQCPEPQGPTKEC